MDGWWFGLLLQPQDPATLPTAKSWQKCASCNRTMTSCTAANLRKKIKVLQWLKVQSSSWLKCCNGSLDDRSINTNFNELKQPREEKWTKVPPQRYERLRESCKSNDYLTLLLLTVDLNATESWVHFYFHHHYEQLSLDKSFNFICSENAFLLWISCTVTHLCIICIFWFVCFVFVSSWLGLSL